jgi:hypothetical protein
MSVTKEHANSGRNLSTINSMSAVYGKNLLTAVGMAPTNEELISAKSNSTAKISQHFLPQTLLW